MPSDSDLNIVHSFFWLHPVMTLTTVTEDGTPQNAAVYVYIDEKMNCYCVTRETTRKFKNITANGKAVLSAYDENVVMFGELLCEASILDTVEEIARVTPELQKIVASRKSEYWIPPVSQHDGERYVFIKLQPKKVTFINYDKSTIDNPKPYKVEFEM